MSSWHKLLPLANVRAMRAAQWMSELQHAQNSNDTFMCTAPTLTTSAGRVIDMASYVLPAHRSSHAMTTPVHPDNWLGGLRARPDTQRGCSIDTHTREGEREREGARNFIDNQDVTEDREVQRPVG
jgi:hypothetical protein